jgi:hypothetical protein
MKEAENKVNLNIRFRYVFGAIILIVCITVITSYVTVKTLGPTLSTSTPTPITLPTIQPLSTFYVLPSATFNPKQTQRSEFEEPLRKNMGFEIETNLLQNSSFENDLAGWTYMNDPEGIAIFETNGVNGKAFCSRRPVLAPQTDRLGKEWIGLAQEFPLDPTQSYFFSAWIKLNEARNISVYAKFYSGTTEAAIQYLGDFGYTQPETSNGWFFIHHVADPSPITRTPNRIEIEVVHGKLDINPNAPPTFSTICIDDVFFGRIVK